MHGFFVPQHHERSQTVANTFHGTDYQIMVLSWYLIDYLLNHHQDYELTTEPDDIAKFDDVVLLTRSKREFIQVKHSKDPDGTYEINDFAGKGTDGKKVQLHSYFDQWLPLYRNSAIEGVPFNFILFSNHQLSERKGLHYCVGPDGKFYASFIYRNPQPVYGNITQPANIYDPQQCIPWHSDRLFHSILTNSEVINEYSLCLVFNEAAIYTHKIRVGNLMFVTSPAGKTLVGNIIFLYKNTNQQIVAAWLNGDRYSYWDLSQHLTKEDIESLCFPTEAEKYTGITSSTSAACKKLIIKIRTASNCPTPEQLRQFYHDRYIELIQQFLSQFIFQLGELNREQLANRVKEQLRVHFAINNDALANALYVEVKNWLAQPRALSFTAQTTRIFLNLQHAHINLLQQWVGLTKRRFDTLPVTINGRLIQREGVLRDIDRDLCRNYSVLIITGEAGIGKSSLIKLYYQSHQPLPLDGEWIYLEPSELKQENLAALQLDAVKRIIIDNTETVLGNRAKIDLLRSLISKLPNQRDKKLVFIIQENHLDNVQSSLGLNDENAITYIAPRLDRVDIDPNILELIDKARPVAATGFIPSVFEVLLTIPFYLNLIAEKASSLQNTVFLFRRPKLEDYLIKLKIMGDAIAGVKTAISGKVRRKTLESLLYQSSQRGQKNIPLPNVKLEVIRELLNDGIIIQHADATLAFSHSIFEYWTLRQLMKKFAQEAVDEQHETLFIFERLYKALPTDINACILILDQHIGLGNFLLRELKAIIAKFDNISFEPERLLFHQYIILMCILLNNNESLERIFQVGDFDLDMALDSNFNTYMNVAIDMANADAITILMENNANQEAPSAREFFGERVHIEDVTDDPPEGYSDDSGNYSEEGPDFEGEEYYKCGKDVFRAKRYDSARNNRIEQGLGRADDGQPHNFDAERLSKAPYLIRVAFRGFVKLVGLFWEKRDEPLVNTFLETPLHVAILQERVEMVGVLLREYHPVEVQDFEGDTPLHNAIYMRNKVIFELVITEYRRNPQFDINRANQVGWTPLHLAILQGEQDMIDVLLACGADLNIEDKAGNTAVALCKKINKLRKLELTLGSVDLAEDSSNDDEEEGSDEDEAALSDDEELQNYYR